MQGLEHIKNRVVKQGDATEFNYALDNHGHQRAATMPHGVSTAGRKTPTSRLSANAAGFQLRGLFLDLRM